MFWLGPSPSDFHKTYEDPKCLIKEDPCKNNNIFGRHASNGPKVERNFASTGDIIFLLQNLDFVINFKQLRQTPVKEVESLGLVKNSVKVMLAVPQKKVLHIQNKCMELIASPKTTIMELNKLLRKLSFPVQAVIPGRIQYRYL